MADKANQCVLRFRRQFVLGREPFAPNGHWLTIEINNGLTLSAHEDLPAANSSGDERAVSLLGIAIHPFHPQWTESDIVQHLLATALDLTALLEAIRPLSGRWVLVFQLGNKTIVLTDPCGYRTVYYDTCDTQIRCASQPALLHAQAPMALSQDTELHAFLRWPVFAKKESAFVGDRTIYRYCHHLMPNFYLDLTSGCPVRFFGTSPLGQREPAAAAAEA